MRIVHWSSRQEWYGCAAMPVPHDGRVVLLCMGTGMEHAQATWQAVTGE